MDLSGGGEGREGGGGGGRGVHVKNLQVLLQEILCHLLWIFGFQWEGDGISYKDDNSTLAPASPVLLVGFISSDIEYVIHCQVGLFNSAYINAILF